MSVGGNVTDVLVQKDRVYINTNDGSCDCAIFVEKDSNSEKVKINDVVWWQGDWAYWTTADRESVIEQKLKRRGFSGVQKPQED